MDATNWAITAAVVVGTIGVLTTSYLRFLQERQSLREQRYRFELELRRADQLISGSESTTSNEAFRELRNMVLDQGKLLKQIASRPAPRPDERTSSELTNDQDPPPLPALETGGTQSLVREISHSLNTPLSQIEITLSLLSENGAALREEDRSSLRRAITSVAVCKAFIRAFRSVVLAESTHDLELSDLQHGSLGEVLESATGDLAASRGVTFESDQIETSGFHSEALMIAILIPIVDNAIEASPPGAQVRLVSAVEGNRQVLRVQNELASAPPTDMLTPRFTTKPGHDGMGLVVTTRLLNSIPGSQLRSSWDGLTMTFEIELPRSGR